VKRFLLLLTLVMTVGAQEIYDLLLKNGQVIDPKNGRNERLDIAIAKGRVQKVAAGIPAAHSRRVVDLSDYSVTPGLIDINGHFGADGVNPDHNSLRSGVTTVVDAGSASGKTFESFKTTVIAHSRTRVLAFVNGGTDTAEAVQVAAKYPEVVVGLRGGATGKMLAMGDSLAQLRSGDILTNIYSLSAPPLAEARKKGILLDVGQFWFRVAVPALKQGLLPDTISTGMDKESLLLPRATMSNVISKFLAMGLTMEQIIQRTTIGPAKAIRRPDLGSIEVGGVADLAVLEVRPGAFSYLDAGHAKITGSKEVRCVLTVRNGVVVWDSEGLSLTHWRDAGPYSNYK
jgi:dihydroorotase